MKLMNPIFYERTKDGETYQDIHSKLIKDRTLFINEPIDSEMGGTIVALLFLLDSQDSDEKITLWINTPGGCAVTCFAIYDVMQTIKAPVETICIGEASSAGAILLAAGSRGRRCALPNSRIMIHQVQAGIGHASQTDVAIQFDEIKKINNKVHEILAAHTGHSISKIKKDCQRDKFLSAEEALKYGLIDNIISYKKDVSKPKTKK